MTEKVKYTPFSHIMRHHRYVMHMLLVNQKKLTEDLPSGVDKKLTRETMETLEAIETALQENITPLLDRFDEQADKISTSLQKEQ